MCLCVVHCRQRLYQIVTPVLRLVLVLLASAPGSQDVRAQASAFVAAHTQLILRLLQEAGASGEGARCLDAASSWTIGIGFHSEWHVTINAWLHGGYRYIKQIPTVIARNHISATAPCHSLSL